MSKRIFVVRHGEYDFKEGLPLSEKGKEQARRAGEELAKLGMTGSTVLTSSAKRTVETAEEITKSIGGVGPFAHSRLYNESITPWVITDFDQFIDDLLRENDQEYIPEGVVIVSHAELLLSLSPSLKSMGQVAFCETVEYMPGTWKQQTLESFSH